MYDITVHNRELVMNSISVNQFRDNLKTYVEQTVNEHEPIKVTRRAGEDFIVMSADDWEREQETLHILQSSNLMQQIAESMSTHESNKGYTPTKEQLDEITSL
jgi:antitoxin YefM